MTLKANAPSGGPGLHDRVVQLPIDRLPLAYILLDAENRICEWNPAAERIFGHKRSEALGRLGLELLLPTPMPPQVQTILRRIRTGDLDAHSINENRTKDGRRIICQWFNTPLAAENGAYAGVVSLGQDITEQQQAKDELGQYAVRLQELSRRVIEVQESERGHVARELHDEIGQILSTISVNLENDIECCQCDARARLAGTQAIVNDAIRQVNDLSLDLRPSMLDDLGLGATLQWCAERQTRSANCELSFDIESSGDRLPADLEIACYRVAQEALTNVVRHARAKRVRIEFREHQERVSIQIRDDGVGFDVANLGRSATQLASFGVRGMQERVELLGGTFQIETGRGNGTSIRASFPLLADDADANRVGVIE